MTASIVSRDPAPATMNVGTRAFVRASVAGEVLSPVVQSDVSVRISGVDAVVDGVVMPGFDASFATNSAFGVDVTIRSKQPMPSDAWQSVRVTAPGLDDGWSFRTAESIGPRLVGVSPAIGVDAQAGLPLVQFDVVDDTGPVPLRVVEQEVNDGVLSGSQLSSDEMDFRGTEGQLVDIAGTPAFIVSVIGPHIVVTTHSGGGTGLNVKLFRRHGLDVTIAGSRVVASGEVLPASGWTVSITEPNPGQRRVTAQRLAPSFGAGDRVDVDVRARDSTSSVENVSVLRTHFYVGDRTGPRVGGLAPAPGTRGLSVATTTQPVFDIIDRTSDVLLSSVNVFVDGVQAVTNGSAGGDFSTSTVASITDGRRVTLRKSTAWPAREVLISVRATDNAGNAMPECTWIWHFGATNETWTSDVAGGELVSDDVLRAVSFDLSRTSFAAPVERGHTGYAADGYWYEAGAKDAGRARATWATEAASSNRAARDEFPVSGHIVVTGGSWSILDAAGRMWARCVALGSGSNQDWSMAGGIGQALADVDFAADGPVVFLAAGAALIVVDFAQDRAWRMSAAGRTQSTGTVGTRNANQSGGAIDTSYAMSSSSSSFVRCTGVAFDGSWVAIAVRDALVEFVGNLDAVRTDIEAVRGPFTSQARAVVLPVSEVDGGSWARVRACWRAGNTLQPLLAVLTDSVGAARLLVCDWVNVFAYLQGEIAVHGAPLPVEQAQDCAHVVDEHGRWLTAVATSDRVVIAELTSGGSALSTIDDLSEVDLSLDTVSGGSVSCVELDRGFQADRGYVYVGAIGAGDGKAVRWRHQPATASLTGQLVTMSSGLPVRALSVLGSAELDRARYVRASMALLASDQSFVRASMEVSS